MKGLTLFLSALAMVAAGISGLLYFNTGNEKGRIEQELATARSELARKSQGLTEVSAERDELSSRAKSIENDLNELKARNTTLEARNSQLSREMTQLREQQGNRLAADQAASRQIADLNRQLLEAKSAPSAPADGATSEQVARYQTRITELEAEAASLRAAGIGPSDGDPLAGVPANLTANVIDVGPRAAFVVLDIGTRNGAAPSLEMVLRRGSVIIAHVRLTDVKETYSVAQVLPRTGTGTVRPGDTASRS